MRARTAAVGALFVFLALLAGCQGTGTDRVTLETDVRNATPVADGWQFEVVVRSDRSSTGHRWENVTVTGHGIDSARHCKLDVGTVEADSAERGVMTCERLPLVVAVRSDALGGAVSEDYEGVFAERIGRESETDTLLRAEGAALTWFNESGPAYGAVPLLKGGVSEIEVTAYDYARCRVLVSGADESDFRGRTPWLDRDVRSQSPNETRVVVRAANGSVRRGNETLQPTEFPPGPATAGLRSAIRGVQANGTAGDTGSLEVIGVDRGDATEITFRYTGAKSDLTDLHAALLAPGDDESAAVDFLGDVPDRADNGTLPHAAGVEALSVEPFDTCARTPFTFNSEGTAGAVYLLELDGRTWMVEVTSEFRRPAEGGG